MFFEVNFEITRLLGIVAAVKRFEPGFVFYSTQPYYTY